MQKARRHHTYAGLRPLVSAWFQVLFTPFLRVLFTFPLQYWFAIGLSVVFSLTRWCWQIQTGFLRPRPTHDTHHIYPFAYRTITLLWSRLSKSQFCSPTTLCTCTFGLFRFRSPLLTESLLFSFPPGT